MEKKRNMSPKFDTLLLITQVYVTVFESLVFFQRTMHRIKNLNVLSTIMISPRSDNYLHCKMWYSL